MAGSNIARRQETVDAAQYRCHHGKNPKVQHLLRLSWQSIELARSQRDRAKEQVTAHCKN